jgi:hypothetical protein
MAFNLTSIHGTNNTSTISMGSVTGGDLLVVCELNTSGSGLTISAFTDTVGTVYNRTLQNDSGGGNTLVTAWGFAGGSGSNSVTITWSVGTTGRGAWAQFDGSSVPGCVVDVAPVIATGSGTSITTPSITTAGADDLVLNYVDQNNGTTTFNSPWSTAASASFVGGIAYQADVVPGAYAANATIGTTGAWRSISFALQAVPVVFRPRRMPLGM